MAMQNSRDTNLQKPIWVRQPIKLSVPQMEERYFEKLAAFGLACLAAAIVGKLVMTVLTPKQPNRKDG